MAVTFGKIQFNVEIEQRDMDAVNALCERYGVNKSALVRLLVRDRVVQLRMEEGFEVIRKASDKLHAIKNHGGGAGR